MQATPKITLLTTLGCHLCDHAKTELWQAQSLQVFDFVECDIALNDDDIAAYGTKIPVLRCETSQKELNWPFTAQDILALLAP